MSCELRAHDWILHPHGRFIFSLHETPSFGVLAESLCTETTVAAGPFTGRTLRLLFATVARGGWRRVGRVFEAHRLTPVGLEDSTHPSAWPRSKPIRARSITVERLPAV